MLRNAKHYHFLFESFHDFTFLLRWRQSSSQWFKILLLSVEPQTGCSWELLLFYKIRSSLQNVNALNILFRSAGKIFLMEAVCCYILEQAPYLTIRWYFECLVYRAHCIPWTWWGHDLCSLMLDPSPFHFSGVQPMVDSFQTYILQWFIVHAFPSTWSIRFSLHLVNFSSFSQVMCHIAKEAFPHLLYSSNPPSLSSHNTMNVSFIAFITFHSHFKIEITIRSLRKRACVFCISTD